MTRGRRGRRRRLIARAGELASRQEIDAAVVDELLSVSRRRIRWPRAWHQDGLRAAAELLWSSGASVVEDDPAAAPHRRLFVADPSLVHPRARDVLGLEPRPFEEQADLGEHNDQGSELLDQAQSDGDPELLQHVVAIFRAVVAGTTEHDPLLPGRLGNLSAALSTRHEFFGARGDLDEALALARRAVRCADADDPELPRLLSNLASTLGTSCELGGSDADLEEAIAAARRAVDTMSADDSRRTGYRSNLSAILDLAYSRTGEPEYLDAAVQVARDAVADPGRPLDLAHCLVNLSNALQARHLHSNDTADLDAAVDACQQAAELVPAGHPGRPGVLAALGATSIARFMARGDAADMDAAASAYQQAAEATPTGHPHRSRYLAHLSNVLRMRFEATGAEVDLDRAVGIAESADEHPGALGNALLARYEPRGRWADLDSACTAYRLAVEQAGRASRPGHLANLAGAMHQRFTAGGDLDDLAFAIDCAREAVGTLPLAHRDRPACVNSLVKVLQARFALLAQQADLDEAIDACRLPPDEIDLDRPDHLTQLTNLTALLRLRHVQLSSPEDLADAVAASYAIAGAVHSDHPHRAAILTTHGNVLITAAPPDDTAMIDDAIDAHTEAVRETAPHDVARTIRLMNLSAGWAARFARTHRVDDLDHAIDAARDAVAEDTTNPDHARCRSNLGVLLTNRYALSEQPADLAGAAAAWDLAMTSETASPSIRVGAARQLAELAHTTKDDETALRAYTTAVDLMSRLGWRGTDRATRQGQLELWSEIATEAAACALDNGLPERAVELLEAGRTVIWAQLLETRTDLTELRAVDPVVADRLVHIRAVLDGFEAESPLAGESDSRDARIRLAHEWDSLVARVRAYDGFANFLKPMPFAELRDAVGTGPVVVLNVSAARCDAIIVTRAGASVVELRRLTATRVAAMAKLHLRVVTGMRRYRELDAAHRAELAGSLRDILASLWDDIAAPVLDALGLAHRERDWPRLWWCPTGQLGLLPLHAAQRYDPVLMRDTGVMDRVVSSYTPSIAALRRATAGQPRSGHALVVGLERTPGLPDLPQAAVEVEVVTRVAGRHRTVLTDSAATVVALRSALTRCTWLHYAGHSGQDLDSAGDAALHLHDGKLTAADIAHLDLPRPSFAFLSSCESGLTAPRLPDEALQLAAALQVAGYRQVVATLWSIGDPSVPEMVERFYALGSDRGAEALHEIVRSLREIRQPSVWAGYFHCGA